MKQAKIKQVITVIFLSLFNLSVIAQVNNDSISSKVMEQGYLNFPAIRTLSIAYETNLSHDYSLKAADKEVEKGKLRGVNTLRFSTMLPIFQKQKFSLFVNGKANMFFIDNDVRYSDFPTLFDKNNYNFISWDYQPIISENI